MHGTLLLAFLPFQLNAPFNNTLYFILEYFIIFFNFLSLSGVSYTLPDVFGRQSIYTHGKFFNANTFF
jgi:hypothetical protein